MTKLINDGDIVQVTAVVTDEPRSACVGTFVRGGGIEIPCSYSIFGRKERKRYVRSTSRTPLERLQSDVGNGPSAISLSYFLSGYRPYYNGLPHPNPYLTEKLQKLGSTLSVVDQELEHLCEGVEGRSSNSVAVLFDALCHPDADVGMENPSVLDWRHEPEHAVSHVVLGKLQPGGAWQKMDSNMQTLSLASWMELPDLPYKDWLCRTKRCSESIELCMNRAAVTEVSQYYSAFVEEKGIRPQFYDQHTVTSVQKVYKNRQAVDDESGESEPCCPNMRQHKYYYEVRGYSVTGGDGPDESQREEFCICALNVVVATGAFDIPNKLGVSGENLPHVSHSVSELESVINMEALCGDSAPVLVVGAGLTAADAILLALERGIPVVHAFRHGAHHSSLVLKKLPQNMYPEYHRVHSLMAGTLKSPLYKPLAKHELVELKEDQKVFLKQESDENCELISIEISHVCILIGARPDLNFLPKGGRDLGVIQKYPVDSKQNPVDIDPFSYQCVHEPGLFAMGPLVGDKFVRFGIGGALGITNYLLSKHKQ